jgi:DNA (cytosine-5)-methyltransferase 1
VRILDLFCGAGGAAKGYADRGHDVTGVDIRKQPRYPYRFVQGDALDVPFDGYDFVHASPPCQRWTRMAISRGTADRHADYITDIRPRLEEWGGPYVIECVTTAPLKYPLFLCGTMFGLGVFRHRHFELSWLPIQPAHPFHGGTVGDGQYFSVTGHPGGRTTRDGIRHGSLAEWRAAMGIPWMTARELAQAIPPAYTDSVMGLYDEMHERAAKWQAIREEWLARRVHVDVHAHEGSQS